MYSTYSSRPDKPYARIIFAAMMMAAVMLAAPVARASAASTTTTLTLSPPSVTSGAVVTLTAATVLSNGSKVTTGLVTFCEAAAAPCKYLDIVGTAQLTVTGTAVINLVPSLGSHNYVAVFNGTKTNATSPSLAQALTVTGQYRPHTTLVPSGSPSAGDYALSATVLGLGSGSFSPTGTLTYFDLSNGSATLGTATLGAGILTQSFAAPVPYQASAANIAVATGDFNGDGHPDVVSVNLGAQSGNVYLGSATGTFTALPAFGANNFPDSVAVGDGTTLSSTQLNATASVPGTFVYSAAAGTTPAAGNDPLSVTFTPTNTADYNTATATVTLTVDGIAVISSGSSSQTVTAGAAVKFAFTVTPVGSTTLPNPVMFSVSGLPAGATSTFAPAIIPAGSAATAVNLTIQTAAASSSPQPESHWPAPSRGTSILLALLLPALGMQSLLRKRRMQFAPRWLALVLFAILSMGAVAGLSG